MTAVALSASPRTAYTEISLTPTNINQYAGPYRQWIGGKGVCQKPECAEEAKSEGEKAGRR